MNPQNGKGSRPRPIADPQGFEQNWERIFGIKPRKDAEPVKGGDESNGRSGTEGALRQAD